MQTRVKPAEKNRRIFRWNWGIFMLFVPGIVGFFLGAVIGYLGKDHEDKVMRQAEAVVVSAPYLVVKNGDSSYESEVKTVVSNGSVSGRVEVLPTTKAGDRLTIWTEDGKITSKQGKTAEGPLQSALIGILIAYLVTMLFLLFVLFTMA